MKNFFKYLRYWYYIGTNWNFALAFFTIYHEIRGEKKYHVDTIEIDKLKNLAVKGNNILHASIYQGCNYKVLEKGFDFISGLNHTNDFIDFGCGKGRALAVAAAYGFSDISGIDFAPALCNFAENNIKQLKNLYPDTKFSIICEDAAGYKIKPAQTVFFLFNPFSQVIMLAVIKNILASLKEKERKIYVMYANPVYKEIFLSAGFDEIYHFKKMTFLEISIFFRDTGDHNGEA